MTCVLILLPLGQNPPDWQEILTHLKDEDYKSYYTLLAAKKLKVGEVDKLIPFSLL